jgi:ABC-type sugar transport system permease subunit
VKESRLGAVLVAPSILFLIVILIVPLIYTVYNSFFDLRFLQMGDFLGFKNYAAVFRNREIWHSLGLTIIVTFAGLAISIVVGMLMAVWIHSCQGLTAYFLQIIVLIPWVISMVVGALLWKWLFNTMGPINYLLNAWGYGNVDILANPRLAPCALIFVMAWRTVGFAMVLILAGLKSVPKDLEEAAEVDGANRWNVFWRVRLPLLKTPVMIASVILLLSNFNNVDVPMVLTGGGPGNATNVITMELYRQGFVYYDFGIASALSFITLLINVVLIVLYMKVVKYDV